MCDFYLFYAFILVGMARTGDEKYRAQQEEDSALVRKVQEGGDRASFNKLYDKYKNVIFTYLLRILNQNRDLAEELMQETFITAYKNIHKYRPTGKFFSWLYTIARNVAVSEIRRHKGQSNVSLEVATGEDGEMKLGDMLESRDFNIFEEMVKNRDLRNRINAVLEKMPLKYREAVTLCLMQELSYKEAAKIMKCSVTNVSTTLNRARKMLADLLKKA